MNAIIIDDDPFYVEILVDYCNKAKIKVVGTYNESMNALSALKDKIEADIVFLDIHMPILNGFELLDSLPNTQVIITTQDDTKAVKAFDHNVLDFLLKPIEFSRFIKSISKAETTVKKVTETTTPETEHIFVNINKKLHRLEISEIDFIESQGNYFKIHLAGKEPLTVHSTLKSVKDSLPTSTFMQVHRSFILNLNKIVDIEDNTIVINRSVIPIGKSYREKLINHLKLIN